jgi:NADH:ubiquinone oxidoreductase subunit B-like Fe-S oxidoreductase
MANGIGRRMSLDRLGPTKLCSHSLDSADSIVVAGRLNHKVACRVLFGLEHCMESF